MNPRNVWPAVVLALGAALIVGTLAVLKVDKDTMTLVTMGLIMPVLGALLAAQLAENRAATQQLQQQTNGHQTEMLNLIKTQGETLARMQPPAIEPPAPVEATSTQPGEVPPP
jgi:hypothetical protein